MYSKCSILLMLLIAIISLSSAAINMFSLRDLHSHVVLMPDQLDTAHLEYELNSGKMTPLQLFERLYNVKLDKESIGKVGGAKCEVLELLRKWKESESSDTERDEVIRGIETMEKLKSERYGSEVVEKWEQAKDVYLKGIKTTLRNPYDSRNTLNSAQKKWKFILSMNLPKQETFDNKNIEQYDKLKKAYKNGVLNFFCSQVEILVFTAHDAALNFGRFPAPYFTKMSPDVNKFFKFVNELDKVPTLAGLIQKVQNIKVDVEMIEIIRASGAPEEIGTLISSSKKFKEDYESFEFKDSPELEPIMSVTDNFARNIANSNQRMIRYSQNSEEWQKVADGLNQFKSSESKWELFDKVQKWIGEVKHPVVFSQENIDLLKEMVGLIETVHDLRQKIKNWQEENDKMVHITSKIDLYLRKNKDFETKTKEEFLELVKNTLWKFDEKQIEEWFSTTSDMIETFQKIYDVTSGTSPEKEEKIKLIGKAMTDTGFPEAINNFRMLPADQLKKTIGEVKSLRSMGSVNVLDSAVRTWDLLNEVKTLIDEFEAQKLVDPAEIKISEDPTDKIDKLKNGIPALEAWVEAEEVVQDMKKDFDVFDKFQGFEMIKPTIVEFLKNFEDVKDSEDVKGYSEVISSIANIPAIPKFNFSNEFITFANENSVAEVEKLMDFEKNFADYQLKIKEMGGVFEEVDGWIEQEQKVTTVAPVKTISRYGDQCDCDQIIEDSCGTTCDFDWSSIGL